MLEAAAEAAKYVETEFKRVGMSDTLYNTIMDEYNAFIKRTGESISLTDFIMKVFSSDDAGLSLDTYVKQYVDGFYETLFTALASPDYYTGTAAGQEGYKGTFKETLKQTLINMGFSGNTIESLIEDLLLNGDSLDISKVMANMALRMSGVTAQIENSRGTNRGTVICNTLSSHTTLTTQRRLMKTIRSWQSLIMDT